ncbi:MAG: hypothetical protein KJ574_00580 [Nanoarchaeota archaeon]|nr:hypothetical protein [Nanoarchaeota archaeon]
MIHDDDFQIVNEVECKRCGKRVPIDTMQLDKYGEFMLCIDCFAYENNQVPRNKVGRGVPQEPSRGSRFYSSSYNTASKDDRDRMRQSIPDEMVSYKCAKCKYEFKRRKSFPFSGKCPYCNKPAVQQDHSKNGQWIEKLWKK